MAAEARNDENKTLEFRSFWKAGGIADAGYTNSFQQQQQGELEHARVHPKFLHSNATSHKWAFGAIAELLDNAVDEISKGATFVKVDKMSNMKDQSPILLFQDNGGGMDPGCMRQCMSLGYSNKKGNTIGQYGNGFKTSTMRLGADVIVFSRTTHGSRTTESIGLLSYTFLRTTGQDDVIVPMIDYEISGARRQPIIYSSLEDWSNNLKDILEWSPFSSEQELMQQFEDVGPHGTKIMVYNLWLNDDALLELDFNSDDEDICLRDEVIQEKSSRKNDRLIESHISYRIRFSLRAYVSILYLRPFKNFEIILRGKPVQQNYIVDDLKFTEVVMYKPKLGKASKEVSVKTEIGYVKEAPLLRVSGFNVYHKNRLIRPFWKVNSDHNSMGNGVVGILEANFIEPAHDKQDFERSALFLKLETRLKQMSLDFWKTHFHLIGGGNSSQTPIALNMQKGSSTHLQSEFAANLQSLSNEQPVLVHDDLPTVQPIAVLPAGSSKETAVDSAVDQICEENIQLFMRCEEHRQKETNLKQTIEELEKELAETRRKCSELSKHLETKKSKTRVC
ncbi:hypothetical protein ACHQM5_015458 [Ranunculus cassubicifolius]